MSQYRERNRTRSTYRAKSRDPYRSRVRALYRRLLNRYKPPRPLGGGRGYSPRSAYRPTAERYHSTAEYRPQTKERVRSEVLVRRESSPRVEFPAYRPEPDVEQLLKKLEKRFDEKLHERVLEIMEREFDETRAEALHRYGLPEHAQDEDVRMKIERLQDPEKWEEQKKEHFVEITEDMAENGQEAKQVEKKQDEPQENTTEAKVEDESSTEPQPEVLEADIQTEANSSIEEAELQNAPEPVDSVAENLPEPPLESTVASAETAEPIGAELLEDPILMADIELLYDELEAEELEPEEEIEPGH